MKKMANVIKTGRTIWVDCMGHDEIDPGRTLPTARAWCKECATESAKPIAYINFNAKIGVALKCEKCGSTYAMYEYLYKSRYTGNHTQYGFIPPTHGNDRQAPPRDVRDKFEADKKKRMAKTEEHLASIMGVTVEKYREKRKGWEEEHARARKRIEAEDAKRAADRQQKAISAASEERKRLIAEGILKYSKKQGCLIDTRTNTPYKI